MTPILVTGGTGTLGRAAVRKLTEAGLPVRLLSRRPGPDHVVGDLLTGQGLTSALSGVDTVLHLATTLKGRTDVTATKNLVAAAAGVKHLVFMSIVGIDRIPISYYKGKLAAEQLVEGLPHTILRATQFHDLVYKVLAGAAKLPIMLLPTMSFQPVDVRDVATQLVELAQGGPRGRAPDYGGPEVLPLASMADEYLRAAGKRRPRVPLWLPGKALRALRDGAHMVPPGSPTGTITFAEYVAEKSAR
ncbi:SDR family oxidoreductase [Actinophytocola sp.]|uniref:SDR family oxidoreductase n=1 Tax=Actinophytocola sp. TaxID=1872138 RepID=UPI002ED46D9D